MNTPDLKTSILNYNATEMMIVAAARALAGARTVFVGVGLPNIACNLARRTVAPDLELIYESGVFGARPARLPLSIGDPALVSGSLCATSMADLFGYYLQGGRVDVGFLGGAQVDRFGNLNTTVISDYTRPKVRLPGSGGACEIAIHARRLFYIMRLSKRSFVERLDFVTSPGFPGGRDTREKLGMPGGGPQIVVTDKALFDFNGPGREMRLYSLHPGVSLSEVREQIGWPVNLAERLGRTEEPSWQELEALHFTKCGENLHD